MTIETINTTVKSDNTLISQEIKTGFDAFPLSARLKPILTELGFTTPTPIQAATIPPGPIWPRYSGLC